jgi:hypothetical protein
VKFTIEVKAGYYTNADDLAMVQESLRIELERALDDVARNAFPEFQFTSSVSPCLTPPF